MHLSITCSPCTSECGSAGMPSMQKAFPLAHPLWRTRAMHRCTDAQVHRSPLWKPLRGGARHPRAHSSMEACLAATLAARVMPSGGFILRASPGGACQGGEPVSCRHGSGRRQNGRLFAIGTGMEADLVGRFSLIWTTVLGKCAKRSLQKWPRAVLIGVLMSPKLGLVRTVKGPRFAWYL